MPKFDIGVRYGAQTLAGHYKLHQVTDVSNEALHHLLRGPSGTPFRKPLAQLHSKNTQRREFAIGMFLHVFHSSR